MFIPDATRNICAVTLLREIIFKGIFWPRKIFTVHHNSNHISSFVKRNDKSISELSLFIIAHCSDDKEGLIIPSVPGSVGSRSFFYSRDLNYKLIYGFICCGGQVFNNKKWLRIFPNWVSHNDDIFLLFGTRRLNRKWRRMVFKVSKIVTNSESKSELFTSLKIAYNEEFENSVLRNENEFVNFDLMFMNGINLDFYTFTDPNELGFEEISRKTNTELFYSLLSLNNIYDTLISN